MEALQSATEPLGPIGMQVENLLLDAIDRRSSDLHIDPIPDGTRIRCRVDGFFEDGSPPPAGLHEKIVTRIKVLAGLTVYRRDIIQEGAIRRDDGIELRVSILPTVSGEKVTIRIFDPRTRAFRLSQLGFPPSVRDAIGRFADLRQGTVLLAGPSGSGKTTTLYGMLQRIRDDRGAFTNLCSIEDPVEFDLEAVHQLQVSRDRGLTFARGLSALLRQDPEVILVGEVRDRETAEIAVKAGMTGHLVLTSVHAGRALEALTRMSDLGIEDYLLAASVRAVVAQRLLRRICPHCAVDAIPDRDLLRRMRCEPAGWKRGRGCDACRGSGYLGRVPVAELLEMDGERYRSIRGSNGTVPLERSPLSGPSLLDAALAAARAGETTLEEIARVIDPEEGNG